MELDQHVNRLGEQLEIAARAGGEEALAQRLLAPLDSAVRLMLLDVLAAAAAEITRDLAPGSVELRLRAGEPEFVVALPPTDGGGPAADGPDDAAGSGESWQGRAPTVSTGGAEGGVSRVNLRLPDELKTRVEQAADREGLSINTWLVRAAATAVERGQAGGRREPHAPRGGQRYRGWAQ